MADSIKKTAYYFLVQSFQIITGLYLTDTLYRIVIDIYMLIEISSLRSQNEFKRGKILEDRVGDAKEKENRFSRY